MHKQSWARLVATGTVVLASALVLAACGASSSTSSSKKQVLNLAASAQLDTIDISKSTGYGQTGNVYESFYRLGKNGKLRPVLPSPLQFRRTGVLTRSSCAKPSLVTVIRLPRNPLFTHGAGQSTRRRRPRTHTYSLGSRTPTTSSRGRRAPTRWAFRLRGRIPWWCSWTSPSPTLRS